DLQRVEEMLGATLSLHGWRLRGDPTLHHGGCKVSADEGDLDAMEGQHLSLLRQRLQETFPDQQISFSSYNIFTIASLIASSDLLG
ncbi:FliH/SctL family protein, partial [Salmonella enterica subsp. enterica serovar Montevideo]|nr:FliH/SctL family protein [Salmonella enterica subsp. enterica serovar Montevideo]